MSKQASPRLIGAFVLGAVALFVIFVLIITGESLFRDKSRFVIVFDRAISGLTVGSNVMFRGVPIGYVSSIEVMANYADMSFTVPVYVDIDNTVIKAVAGERFDETEVIGRLIEKGLRAELETESFITGKLFVQLDFHPETPVLLRSEDTSVREIPSIPSGIQAVIADAQAFFEKIQQEVDIGEVLRDFAGTMAGLDELANSSDLREGLAGINSLVNDPEIQQVSAGLNRSLTELRATLAATQELAGTAQDELQPLAANLASSLEQATDLLELANTRLRDDSDLAYRLNTTLREVEQTARSFRILAEYLQQDPNALIRGKATGSD